jgi:hypothetical protein
MQALVKILHELYLQDTHLGMPSHLPVHAATLIPAPILMWNIELYAKQLQ